MNLPSIKSVLLSNAIFSGVGGLALLAAPNLLANIFGTILPWLCIAMGIGLVLFSLQVFWISCDPGRTHRYLSVIFWADCAWVVFTPIALIVFQEYLSFWGNMIFIDIAIIVAIFSFFERQHLKLFEKNGSLIR